MPRVFNFSAGPAMMPTTVLERSAKALLDLGGMGCGVAEISHRGKEFDAVRVETEKRCRTLMGIPDDYAVLFLQGGATQQFEMIPMNFLTTQADFLVTGLWAKKAFDAAKRYGKANCLASTEAEKFVRLPTGWTPTPGADYLHICTNNTIYGTRFAQIPDHPCLIADMSSEIMSRVVDVKKFGMIYAGAQKNLGPAGVVLCIIRKDLLAKTKPGIAPIFEYRTHEKEQSCLNTPPTFGIYVLMEMFRWIEEQGGIAAIEKTNAEKARILYQAIDNSKGFYKGTVTDLPNRSHMNVTYVLPTEELTETFIKQASKEGLVALKGYRSVGGIRASIYNAMPLEGVQKLVSFMDAFRAKNGA